MYWRTQDASLGKKPTHKITFIVYINFISCRSSKLPLLVDIDTGFGSSAFNVKRTVQVHEHGYDNIVHC